MRLILLAAGCLALFAQSLTIGQESPPAKPPYEWILKGDSLDSLEISLVVHHKIDQSTPRGAVEAFLALTDHRETAAPAVRTLDRELTRVHFKALLSREEKLLDKTVRNSLKKERERDEAANLKADPFGYDRLHEPSRVATETKLEDGTVQVETVQGYRLMYPRREEDRTFRGEFKSRFTCARADDKKWRIIKTEAWTNLDTDTMGWREYSFAIDAMFYSSMPEPRPTSEDPKQDTAEDAARSLFNSLCASNFELRTALRGKAYLEHEKALAPLFSEIQLQDARVICKRMWEASDKMYSERLVKAPKSAEDGPDGQKFVVFAIPTGDGRKQDVRVRVKLADGKWQIVGAGTLHYTLDDGRHVAVYKEARDIYTHG